MKKQTARLLTKIRFHLIMKKTINWILKNIFHVHSCFHFTSILVSVLLPLFHSYYLIIQSRNNGSLPPILIFYINIKWCLCVCVFELSWHWLRSSSRRLQRVLEELLLTEREYVRSLGYILTHYLPLLDRADIPQDLRGKRGVIFGNLEKLHDFHSHYFLPELEACEREPDVVARCFLRHVSHHITTSDWFSFWINLKQTFYYWNTNFCR